LIKVIFPFGGLLWNQSESFQVVILEIINKRSGYFSGNFV